MEKSGWRRGRKPLSFTPCVCGKDHFIIIKERSGFCRIAMIRKNKGGRLENVIASVGIVITVCIAIFGYYIRTPYLYGQTSDGFLIRQEVEAGTPVTLAYRHSVQKTMIYEYLAVNETEDGLILKSTKYQSMGVGLPFSKEDGEFRQEGEWFIMDKMNRRCPELSIRNGVTNDEHIIVGDKDYALAELMPLEKELHLYVAPLWKAYWMKKEIRS